ARVCVRLSPGLVRQQLLRAVSITDVLPIAPYALPPIPSARSSRTALRPLEIGHDPVGARDRCSETVRGRGRGLRGAIPRESRARPATRTSVRSPDRGALPLSWPQYR